MRFNFGYYIIFYSHLKIKCVTSAEWHNIFILMIVKGKLLFCTSIYTRSFTPEKSFRFGIFFFVSCTSIFALPFFALVWRPDCQLHRCVVIITAGCCCCLHSTRDNIFTIFSFFFVHAFLLRFISFCFFSLSLFALLRCRLALLAFAHHARFIFITNACAELNFTRRIQDKNLFSFIFFFLLLSFSRVRIFISRSSSFGSARELFSICVFEFCVFVCEQWKKGDKKRLFVTIFVHFCERKSKID